MSGSKSVRASEGFAVEPVAGVVFTRCPAGEAESLLDDLCDAYADAYGVEPTAEKAAAFRERATKALERDRYDLVTVRADGALAGFVFGYAIPPGSAWWDNLTPEPDEAFTVETGERTVLLAEIEVRRAWQGEGLGRALHDEFFRYRAEERATLSTSTEAAEVQRLYEHWGWQKVGRRSRRPGDYLAAYDLFVLPLAAKELR